MSQALSVLATSIYPRHGVPANYRPSVRIFLLHHFPIKRVTYRQQLCFLIILSTLSRTEQSFRFKTQSPMSGIAKEDDATFIDE